MYTFEAENAPPGIIEGFWKNVVAFEEAGWTTQFAKLEQVGVPLPDPASLSDEQIPGALWTVIRALADQDTYLESTDHLSDRQLYTHLWEDSLRERMADVDLPDLTHHIDILGGCSEEDMFLCHKYYANEEDRQHWLKEWPDDEMPPHEDPPYDRAGMCRRRRIPGREIEASDLNSRRMALMEYKQSPPAAAGGGT